VLTNTKLVLIMRSKIGHLSHQEDWISDEFGVNFTDQSTSKFSSDDSMMRHTGSAD